jgi:hypothetical protein
MTAPRLVSRPTATGRPPKRCSKVCSQAWRASAVVGSVPSSGTPGAACRAKACSLWPQSSPIQAPGAGSEAGAGVRLVVAVAVAVAVVVFMIDCLGFGPGRSVYSETSMVGT